MKSRALVALPEDGVKQTIFSPEAMDEMQRLYDVRWNCLDRQMTEDELCDARADAEILITGWGSNKISNRILEAASNLRMIGHTGGTIRYLVDEDFFPRGIPITNANAVMSGAVAEYCLLMAMMARWNIREEMNKLKDGTWHTLSEVVPGLMGASVGIIDYGDIARHFIGLLRHLHVRVYVYAPYLSESFAVENGFELVDLDTAMQFDIVSVHSTLTPESHHMINAEKLSLMRDGAVLINSARGAVIDEEALLRELESGRIKAALDVFETEPLPASHPLRNNLPNVLNTPHIAAASQFWRHRQGWSIIEDIALVLAGKPTKNEITLERYLRLSPSYH